MGADDLLCSRNARLKKALVGRAQWKINQLPSLKEITNELGKRKRERPGALLARRAPTIKRWSLDARSEGWFACSL
jgi:hypothetical protein